MQHSENTAEPNKNGKNIISASTDPAQ